MGWEHGGEWCGGFESGVLVVRSRLIGSVGLHLLHCKTTMIVTSIVTIEIIVTYANLGCIVTIIVRA